MISRSQRDEKMASLVDGRLFRGTMIGVYEYFLHAREKNRNNIQCRVNPKQ